MSNPENEWKHSGEFLLHPKTGKKKKEKKKSGLLGTLCLWLISTCFPSKTFKIPLVALCCSFHCSSAWSSGWYWFEWGDLAGLMILLLRLSASFCFLGFHPLGLNVIKIAENTANNKRSSTFQRLISLSANFYRSEWNFGLMKSVLTSC